MERKATISTDELRSYNGLDQEFKRHLRVNHGRGEYSRGEAHVNTMESFWALLKRGLGGVYQHVSEDHFPKYLDEFAFRFNSRKDNDGDRFLSLLRQVQGKRLLYKQPITN